MARKVYELRGMIYSKYESEAQCARELGWPRQKLSKITNGNKEPDIDELFQLSKALGCAIDDLVDIFLKHKSPIGQLEPSAAAG